MKNRSEYYSSPGKFLITGEYLILEGAEGLSIPLKSGQDLSISYSENHPSKLIWESHYPDGVWFSGVFSIPHLIIIEASDNQFAQRLVEILQAVKTLNPDFLTSGTYSVKTALDFNPEYGFGSSSTLLVNLARWSKTDAFELQKLTFKGSGYDIACAIEGKPVVYHLNKGKPTYRTVSFNPVFAHNIYFVYLGKKRRSKEAIKQFYKSGRFLRQDVEAVSAVTHQIIDAQSLNEFEKLLKEHELILSKVLQTIPVQQQLFSNYNGGIVKSLGAWGGDFVLITSQEDPETFKHKMKELGYFVVYGFKELVKQ